MRDREPGIKNDARTISALIFGQPATLPLLHLVNYFVSSSNCFSSKFEWVCVPWSQSPQTSCTFFKAITHQTANFFLARCQKTCRKCRAQNPCNNATCEQEMGAFRARPWNQTKALKICEWMTEPKNSSCCSWWHIPPKDFVDFDESQDIFSVIRNPEARATSQVGTPFLTIFFAFF